MLIGSLSRRLFWRRSLEDDGRAVDIRPRQRGNSGRICAVLFLAGPGKSEPMAEADYCRPGPVAQWSIFGHGPDGAAQPLTKWSVPPTNGSSTILVAGTRHEWQCLLTPRYPP